MGRQIIGLFATYRYLFSLELLIKKKIEKNGLSERNRLLQFPFSSKHQFTENLGDLGAS